VTQRLGPRLALGVLGLIAAAGVGLISARNVSRQLDVIAACDAVGGGDWGAVIAGTEGLTGDDETGRAATECRCMALLATDRGDACIDLLETTLAGITEGDDDDWAPRPELAVHLIQTWRERSRIEAAAQLARRAARRFPDDPDLFFLELETRSSVEDEQSLLRELRKRLPETGPGAVRMRVSLANRYLFRGDPESALAVLGDAPPAGAGPATGLWFDTRGMALAADDDIAGVMEHYRRWQLAGGDPVELAARYAVTLSIAGLGDPSARPSQLLGRAWADVDRLSDPKLQEAIAIRLILTLVNEHDMDGALAVYDQAHERFAMSGLSRDELQRAATHQLLRESPDQILRGRVRLIVSENRPGDSLLLSPDDAAPVDSAFDSFAVPANGVLAVERSIGTSPLRWVYRDGDRNVLGSGTVNPVPDSEISVAIESRTPRPPQHAALSRRPGDGHRRVAVLLLDCGDWRIVQYLRARGELPVLGALVDSGYRAVLESDPPLTAAALEALVWPTRRSEVSFVGLVHRVGVELAGLASVGENPFTSLEWMLPEADDLFSELGREDRSVANLLLAHGSIRAGRHGEITGPFGSRRRIPIEQSARDLREDERARWPALAEAPAGPDALHVRTIAAEFDTATEIVNSREVDLLALRIEPLDILTHAHFAETIRNRQDDGENLLYSVYRYIDARTGEVHDALDEDDVLIVMSDHGIRTAMEHSPHAIFIAAGPGVPIERAPGRPALRGVAAVLGELVEVATDWPRTGVAPWAGALPRVGAVVASDDAKGNASAAATVR